MNLPTYEHFSLVSKVTIMSSLFYWVHISWILLRPNFVVNHLLAMPNEFHTHFLMRARKVMPFACFFFPFLCWVIVISLSCPESNRSDSWKHFLGIVFCLPDWEIMVNNGWWRQEFQKASILAVHFWTLGQVWWRILHTCPWALASMSFSVQCWFCAEETAVLHEPTQV